MRRNTGNINIFPSSNDWYATIRYAAMNHGTSNIGYVRSPTFRQNPVFRCNGIKKMGIKGHIASAITASVLYNIIQ